MKKFTKGCMITAGFAAVIGIVFFIIGIALGAKPVQVLANIAGDGVYINEDGVNLWTKNSDDAVTLTDSMDEPYEMKDKMNLDISCGSAQVEFVKSQDGKFNATASGVKMKWDVDDDTIILQAAGNRWFTVNAGKVTIYVPEGYVFDDVSIQCGAGTMSIDTLNADELKVELGAGDISMKNIDVNSMKAECGAGEITVDGSIEGNCKAECAMGNIEFNLIQKESDFNYKVECAMGDIGINDSNYSGIGSSKKIDNNAEWDMKLECAMGNININTQE